MNIVKILKPNIWKIILAVVLFLNYNFRLNYTLTSITCTGVSGTNALASCPIGFPLSINAPLSTFDITKLFVSYATNFPHILIANLFLLYLFSAIIVEVLALLAHSSKIKKSLKTLLNPSLLKITISIIVTAIGVFTISLPKLEFWYQIPSLPITLYSYFFFLSGGILSQQISNSILFVQNPFYTPFGGPIGLSAIETLNTLGWIYSTIFVFIGWYVTISILEQIFYHLKNRRKLN